MHMTAWSDELTVLRDVLCGLYTNTSSIVRICDQASIDRSRIPLDGTLIDTWHAVVSEALRCNRIDQLIAISTSASEYQDNDQLKHAVAALRRVQSERCNPGIPRPVGARSELPTRAGGFAGRQEELAKIDSLLRSRDESSPTLVAIHGLSGVGKTQLIREYIELHEDEYETIWWIRADEESTMIADLSSLAESLNLIEFNPRNQRNSANAALSALRHHTGWLLVFDHAHPEAVRRFLPSKGAGHILLSSTNPSWLSLTSDTLSLKGLARHDATSFLLGRTKGTDLAAATRIAKSFDCLPLALEQAAAFVEQTPPHSLTSYERLLETHRSELLDRPSPFTDYPDTVYSAFRLNIGKVEESSPYSAALLAFFSFLNSYGISSDLAYDAIVVLRAQYGEEMNDLVFADLVSHLARFSLIGVDGESFSVHPLVQSCVRDSMTQGGKDTWAMFAVTALTYKCPNQDSESEAWDEWEQIIDHVLASSSYLDIEKLDDIYAEAMLNNAASYLHGLCPYSSVNWVAG